MELKLYRFDIVKTLTMWVSDFQLTAERKQIRLHLDVDDLKGSHEMIADQEKISRIVFNLLSNALKYTPAGGEIFVSLKDEGANLRLDVRDTGKGISQDEADKIFERFFQAKGAASGTGIGLALVKSFVELHHGEARVESEPGKGSDFIVVIPREQEGDSQVIHNDVDIVDNSANASASDGKNVVDESVLQYIDDGDRSRGKVQQLVSENTNRPTVLVIDDNTDIRQYERTLLQDEYIVLEAADGKEGLAVAMKEVPDLVICDVMMPVMDGLEFTEQLKTNTGYLSYPCHYAHGEEPGGASRRGL